MIEEISERIGVVPSSVLAARLLGKVGDQVLAPAARRPAAAHRAEGRPVRPAPRRPQPRRSSARNPHGIVLAEHLGAGRDAKADPPPLEAGAPRPAGDRSRTPSGWRRATAHDPDFPLRLIGLRELRSHNSWMHNAPLLMRGGRTHAGADPSRRRRGGSGSPTASAAGSPRRTARSRSQAMLTDEVKRGHDRGPARLGPQRRLDGRQRRRRRQRQPARLVRPRRPRAARRDGAPERDPGAARGGRPAGRRRRGGGRVRAERLARRRISRS